MNKQATNTRLSPQQVITVYSNEQLSSYYLERREVQSIGGKMTLLAPVPLDEDLFRSIATAFITSQHANLTFEGLIPGHILYGHNDLGKSTVIWFQPAMRRALNFSDAGLFANKLEGTFPVPATLYLATDNNLHIYSLMTDDRPGMNTKLYRAPFFNIYEDGRVCLGTARTGKRSATFEGEAERFERAFYLAEQNGGNNSSACKTKLEALWPRLRDSKAPFPSKDELLQHTKYKTLGDLVRAFAGKTDRNAYN